MIHDQKEISRNSSVQKQSLCIHFASSAMQLSSAHKCILWNINLYSLITQLWFSDLECRKREIIIVMVTLILCFWTLWLYILYVNPNHFETYSPGFRSRNLLTYFKCTVHFKDKILAGTHSLVFTHWPRVSNLLKNTSAMLGLEPTTFATPALIVI